MIRIDEIYDNTFFAWLKKNRIGVRCFHFDPIGTTGLTNIYCQGTEKVWEHNYITFLDASPINLDDIRNTLDGIKYNLAKDIHERKKIGSIGYIVTSEYNSENVNKLCSIYGWEYKHYFFYGWAALDRLRGYDKNFLMTVPYERTIKTGVITVDDNLMSQLDYYSTASVCLVNEQVITGRRNYLTEEVFKPICLQLPFILHSTYKSLEYLRNYGFKTFDNIWDESYDLEIDDQIRAEKISILVSSLNNLSSSEQQELYLKALPIVEHNYNHFYNNGFEKILWSELVSMLHSIREETPEYVNK